MAAQVLRDNTYVDDVLAGGDTVASAQERVKQVDALLGKGGLTLRKWVSSEEDILKSIDESRRLPVEKIFGDQDATLCALGLKWNPTPSSLVSKKRFYLLPL